MGSCSTMPVIGSSFAADFSRNKPRLISQKTGIHDKVSIAVRPHKNLVLGETTKQRKRNASKTTSYNQNCETPALSTIPTANININMFIRI